MVLSVPGHWGCIAHPKPPASVQGGPFSWPAVSALEWQINERRRSIDIGCCLWPWSKVIASFVTFPCKLRIMALINFQVNQRHFVRRWHFDIGLLSGSYKDKRLALAAGHWLPQFSRDTHTKKTWQRGCVSWNDFEKYQDQKSPPDCSDTSLNKCALTLGTPTHTPHKSSHSFAFFQIVPPHGTSCEYCMNLPKHCFLDAKRLYQDFILQCHSLAATRTLQSDAAAAKAPSVLTASLPKSTTTLCALKGLATSWCSPRASEEPPTLPSQLHFLNMKLKNFYSLFGSQFSVGCFSGRWQTRTFFFYLDPTNLLKCVFTARRLPVSYVLGRGFADAGTYLTCSNISLALFTESDNSDLLQS